MDKLIKFYKQHLNLQDATFSPIVHADALVAIVYKITHSDGAHAILKICPRVNDFLREVYFLKYFADKLPVPRIIETVEPKQDVYGAILMEYFQGELLKLADLSDKIAYEMGQMLALIHLNRTSGYGDLTQPESMEASARDYFTSRFENDYNECVGHLPEDLLSKCRKYFDEHIHLLNAVDGPCIIHRDFRPGNIIINQGKIMGIIDWASARSSFAQEDFCAMEHGNWSRDASSKEAFLAGYAVIRPVPDYKELMPLLRVRRALATIGFTVKHNTWSGSNADLYRFNRDFLERI